MLSMPSVQAAREALDPSLRADFDRLVAAAPECWSRPVADVLAYEIERIEQHSGRPVDRSDPDYAWGIAWDAYPSGPVADAVTTAVIGEDAVMPFCPGYFDHRGPFQRPVVWGAIGAAFLLGVGAAVVLGSG